MINCIKDLKTKFAGSKEFRQDTSEDSSPDPSSCGQKGLGSKLVSHGQMKLPLGMPIVSFTCSR